MCDTVRLKMRCLVTVPPSDDPWGGRYRVSCSSDGIVVVSPGRDQKPGTADDVRVPRG